MTTDRLILLGVFLTSLTMGVTVVYEEVVKDKGIVCHVRGGYLSCPPGVTWKGQIVDEPWKVVNLYP